MIQQIPAKSSLCAILVQFDFSSFFTVGQNVSAVLPTATVYAGSDPNPQNVIGPTHELPPLGLVVTQILQGGVVGTIYKIQLTASASDGSSATMTGYLAIVNDPL